MSSANTIKYLIIAGTNKAGTTAVFRYLGDHPDVSVSRQKESRFFYRNLESNGESDDAVRARYESQFLVKKSHSLLRVEATPTYLHGGNKIASRIHEIVPDAMLLFMLRNPTDRVVSYYRSSFGQPHVATYGLDSDQFVDEAIRGCLADLSQESMLSDRQKAFRQELRVCQYADFLPSFLQYFPAERTHIAFFDQLQDSPSTLITNICRFSGIDPGFYDDYTFRVENRTRPHRSLRLRNLAAGMNTGLEPILNRFPGLRRGARHIYDFVNVNDDQVISFSADARQRLDGYFQPWNDALHALMLDSFPEASLPSWLQPITSEI